tara:strand:- start:2192 stop:2293 length:102 start_codon:yes stop_codon:yes gene_type:complete
VLKFSLAIYDEDEVPGKYKPPIDKNYYFFGQAG